MPLGDARWGEGLVTGDRPESAARSFGSQRALAVMHRVSPVWRYRQIWRYRAKSGKGWRWAPPAQLAVNRAAAGHRRQRAASLGRPHRQLSRLSRDEFRYSPITMGVLELLQAGAQRRRAPKRPATYLDSLDDTDQGVQAAITTLLDHVIQKVESAESGSGPSRGARSNCSTAAAAAAAAAAVLVIDLTEAGATVASNEALVKLLNDAQVPGTDVVGERQR